MRQKSGNGHHVDLEAFLEDLKTVVRDGQELLRSGVSGAREKVLSGARTTDRALRQRVYQTMGFAFGMGVIAGLMLSGTFSGAGEEFEED